METLTSAVCGLLSLPCVWIGIWARGTERGLVTRTTQGEERAAGDSGCEEGSQEGEQELPSGVAAGGGPLQRREGSTPGMGRCPGTRPVA